MSRGCVTLYYHRSQLLYRKGDVIPPGNWGRVILGIGPAHKRFYPEYVLETIRRVEFTEKPSRMAAAFMFESHAGAVAWPRTVIQGIQEHVYAVTVPEGVPTHHGNFGWIDAMPLYRTFEGVEECARRYWRGDDRNPEQWEYVVSGALTVVDRLSKLEENGHA
jgi:hypothetical protein